MDVAEIDSVDVDVGVVVIDSVDAVVNGSVDVGVVLIEGVDVVVNDSVNFSVVLIDSVDVVVIHSVILFVKQHFCVFPTC